MAEAEKIERSASGVPLRLRFGVLLVSAAVLASEVALTRVFSAVLRYHFVFLVISAALLRQIQETYSIQNIQSWMRQHGYDVNDLVAHVAQMIRVIKHLGQQA